MTPLYEDGDFETVAKQMCEAARLTQSLLLDSPCEMKAKHLVQMEGRPPIKVCGRHVGKYRREIAIGWRGTITPISEIPGELNNGT